MRSLTARLIALLLLLLQTAGLSATRVLHAADEARALDQVVHIESPEHGACIPDADENCQTCRLLTALCLTSPRGSVLAVRETNRSLFSRAHGDVSTISRVLTPLGSRPPPNALT